MKWELNFKITYYELFQGSSDFDTFPLPTAIGHNGIVCITWLELPVFIFRLRRNMQTVSLLVNQS